MYTPFFFSGERRSVLIPEVFYHILFFRAMGVSWIFRGMIARELEEIHNRTSSALAFAAPLCYNGNGLERRGFFRADRDIPGK